MNATLAKLHAAARQLEKLAPPFTWHTNSRARVEETGTRDPPCAQIVGTFGPYVVELDADGEVYFPSLGEDVYRLTIDMQQPPKSIAASLIDKIRDCRFGE